MRKTGMNLISVKERNRALLLQLICTSKQITRSELSDRLHLSPMTVTNITSEYLQRDIIEEVVLQDHAKTPGRTPMLLQLSQKSAVVAGVFVSRSGLSGAICDMSLNMLANQKVAFESHETAETILEKMRVLIEHLLAQMDRPILGIGISTAGIVDDEAGKIRYITDFFGIQELGIKEYLSQFLDYPIFVSNDMQAAGLCELYFGTGRSEDDFLYVGVCNGVGAAVITGHELLDACGELGHMTVNSSGPQCTCGSFGCLELYASTSSILKNIYFECGIRLCSLAEAVEFSRTNKVAYAVLYNATRQLALGINNFLNLINVSVVVLGHDAYYLPDDLIQNMESLLSKINVAMHKRLRSPCLLRSSFGENAPLFGSICVVLEQLFCGTLTLWNQAKDAAGDTEEDSTPLSGAEAEIV